jgi:quercetin dioxygenase-like cupin family protein
MSHAPTAVIRAKNSVPTQSVPRCRKTSIQVLLGPESGVPNFIARQFTIEPGGRIPCHRHDTIEHEQVILDGAMIICLDGRETEVSAGDSIFIPAGVSHWYENRGPETVRFLCVVPHTDDYQTEWLEGPAE